MKVFLFVLIIIIGFGATAFATVVYNPGTGHYYERIDLSGNWYQAKSLTENMSYMGMQGYLVTITSEAENSWIVSNLGGKAILDHWLGGFWQGGGDLNDNWAWTTEEPWSYANWMEHEPNSTLENALQFDADEGGSPLSPGYWNDLNAFANTVGFIVEFEPNPVPIPGAIYLFGSGLIGLAGIRKKFRR